MLNIRSQKTLYTFQGSNCGNRIFIILCSVNHETSPKFNTQYIFQPTLERGLKDIRYNKWTCSISLKDLIYFPIFFKSVYHKPFHMSRIVYSIINKHQIDSGSPLRFIY